MIRLLAYDACAWQTSDALMKRPSAELAALTPHWICFQIGLRWHGVFGSIVTKRFSSSLTKLPSGGDSWVHVVRDTAPE